MGKRFAENIKKYRETEGMVLNNVVSDKKKSF